MMMLALFAPHKNFFPHKKVGRLGAAKLSPFLVSQGWSYNCDASWKSWFLGGVYCKVSDNAWFSLVAVGEERFHPTGLPALLLGKGEGQPSWLCLSRAGPKLGPQHFTPGKGTVWEFKVGTRPCGFALTFNRIWCICLSHPLVIL